ncbi:uncharacterized protein TNCV_1416191 [Trichonephila clavipes]|nr:uncharacterized protein TNCV_1416191 [Trichonephila clavipes]
MLLVFIYNGPAISKAKFFLQQLWLLKLEWHEKLPVPFATEWASFVQSLPVLEKLKFPRFVLSENQESIILYGFNDASEKGFGVVTYVSVIKNNSDRHSQLLCSKSRVAPLKTLTQFLLDARSSKNEPVSGPLSLKEINPAQRWLIKLVQKAEFSNEIKKTQEDEAEKLAYQLNEEAERTERPIRRLSKVMYGSTCADMQVDVMGECLSSIKHVVGTTSGCFYPRSNHWEKLEEGRSVTSVAAEFGIAHRIVSRLWRQFQTTGTGIRRFSSGRPRRTTPADDRYIVLQARRNRRQTAGEIARHTTQATGRPISRFTVARRLHGGLFARRPVRCVYLLTPAHRRRRSLWCREHRNWRDNEWYEYSLQMRADSV